MIATLCVLLIFMFLCATASYALAEHGHSLAKYGILVCVLFTAFLMLFSFGLATIFGEIYYLVVFVVGVVPSGTVWSGYFLGRYVRKNRAN